MPWASVWELCRLEEKPAAVPPPPPEQSHSHPPPEADPEPAGDPASGPPDPGIAAELLAGRRAQSDLEAMRRSTSWRLTAPIRLAKTRLSRLLPNG